MPYTIEELRVNVGKEIDKLLGISTDDSTEEQCSKKKHSNKKKNSVEDTSENFPSTESKKSKKNKTKKQLKCVEECKPVHSIDSNICDSSDGDKKDAMNTQKADTPEYIDGYRVVADVPSDDSDIEDAFEFDEDSMITQKADAPQYVDGYRVVTEVPSDDSDIGDAFEFEEDLGMDDAKPDASQQSNDIINPPKNSSYKTIKNKKLQKLIDECGIDMSIISENAPVKESKQHVFMDISQKRGKRKANDNHQEQKISGKEKTIQKKNESEQQMKKYLWEMKQLTKPKGKKRREATLELLYKLGAKRPKAKPVNYKILMQQRKEEKIAEKEKRVLAKKDGLKVKKKTTEKKSRSLDPRIGHFQDGILKISKKDIRKINKNS